MGRVTGSGGAEAMLNCFREQRLTAEREGGREEGEGEGGREREGKREKDRESKSERERVSRSLQGR